MVVNLNLALLVSNSQISSQDHDQLKLTCCFPEFDLTVAFELFRLFEINRYSQSFANNTLLKVLTFWTDLYVYLIYNKQIWLFVLFIIIPILLLLVSSDSLIGSIYSHKNHTFWNFWLLDQYLINNCDFLDFLTFR